MRDVLGGGVPERDGVCRYEDADAASGPCARGDALQGVEDADERCQERGAPVQGQAVQLFRVSGEGCPSNQYGMAAREDTRPPVFGTVIKYTHKVSARMVKMIGGENDWSNNW